MLTDSRTIPHPSSEKHLFLRLLFFSGESIKSQPMPAAHFISRLPSEFMFHHFSNGIGHV